MEVKMSNMSDVVSAAKAKDDAENKSNTTPTDTASSSSTVDDQPDSNEVVYGEVVLAQLAKQLEYYFSEANLSKDTYVETLRNLNDGCVPVTILARFAKVQALVPFGTPLAIAKAATEFSSALEVFSIDTSTGKRSVESGPKTISAVGTHTGKPLNTLAPVSPLGTPQSTVQNTIILRDVDPMVTEEEVRELFSVECPPILSLYADVAHCWFATLDTTSRDDILYVIMQLRTRNLRGDPVRPRLKSLARQVDLSAAPTLPIMPHTSAMPQLSMMPFHSDSSSTKKKKQKKRPKNKIAGGNKKGFNAGAGRRSSSTSPAGNKKVLEHRRASQPDLSSASFPALNEDSCKEVAVVEVSEHLKDDAPTKQASDAASTATTTSSSSSSINRKHQQQQIGGYAAALLKAKPVQSHVVKVEQSKKSSEKSSEGKRGRRESSEVVETQKKNPEATDAEQTPAPQPVVITPPSWGGGRSFADVLGKDEALVAAM